MLKDLLSPPIWRPENSVNIWNLLWLPRQLIICTKPKNIYTSTFPNTLTHKMAKNHEISVTIFFDKRNLSFMSPTAIHVTPKFKMRWFSNEGRY